MYGSSLGQLTHRHTHINSDPRGGKQSAPFNHNKGCFKLHLAAATSARLQPWALLAFWVGDAVWLISPSFRCALIAHFLWQSETISARQLDAADESCGGFKEMWELSACQKPLSQNILELRLLLASGRRYKVPDAFTVLPPLTFSQVLEYLEQYLRLLFGVQWIFAPLESGWTFQELHRQSAGLVVIFLLVGLTLQYFRAFDA